MVEISNVRVLGVEKQVVVCSLVYRDEGESVKGVCCCINFNGSVQLTSQSVSASAVLASRVGCLAV